MVGIYVYCIHDAVTLEIARSDQHSVGRSVGSLFYCLSSSAFATFFFMFRPYKTNIRTVSTDFIVVFKKNEIENHNFAAFVCNFIPDELKSWSVAMFSNRKEKLEIENEKQREREKI